MGSEDEIGDGKFGAYIGFGFLLDCCIVLIRIATR